MGETTNVPEPRPLGHPTSSVLSHLPSPHPFPHSYHLLSLSPLSAFLNPFFLFPPHSRLPYFYSPSLSLSFLPVAFSLTSLSCPLFSLSFCFLSSPPAYSPGLAFPSTLMPGVEKTKAREAGTPLEGEPQPSDNGALSAAPAHPTPSLVGVIQRGVCS